MRELINFTIDEYRGAILGAIFGSALTALITLIGFAIAYLAKRFRQALARNIWKPFLKSKKPTCVVLTTKKSTRVSGTPKVSLSEVQGFSEVRRTLAGLGVEANLVEKPDVHFNQLGDAHIIAIGGPKHNNVTREVIAAVARTYSVMPFGYDEVSGGVLVNGCLLTHEENATGDLAKDYGIVVRATGVAGSKDACALIAFGIRGHGTWGAIKAITEDKNMMLNIEKSVGLSDFALLLEFNFDRNFLVSSRVMLAVSLIPV